MEELRGSCGEGGEKDFGEEGGGPKSVLEGGAGSAGGAGGEPGGGEEQRDLPEGVEGVGEEEGFERRRCEIRRHEVEGCEGEREGVHYFSSSARRRESSAIFFASIWRLLIRLITNSSEEPPNMRSTRSRTAWVEALASVTVAA